MAQQFIYENTMQSTVNFSTVENGDIFIYASNPCVRLDNNNPNYVIIGTGVKGKMNDTDQVLLPSKSILKVE